VENILHNVSVVENYNAVDMNRKVHMLFAVTSPHCNCYVRTDGTAVRNTTTVRRFVSFHDHRVVVRLNVSTSGSTLDFTNPSLTLTFTRQTSLCIYIKTPSHWKHSTREIGQDSQSYPTLG